MKLTGGQSCLLLIVFALLIAGFQAAIQQPGGIALMILAVIAIVAGTIYSANQRKNRHLQNLQAQAEYLDKLANGEFSMDGVVFATNKSEEVVMRLNNITLSEYRSNGSTYQGAYGGLSFRVAKGVRANVGRTAGQSTRNPEVSTPLDKGGVTFTNQRIVFAGHNMVREWDLDKLVNMATDANGANLEIAVSNRDKTSLLYGLNYPELTPGMAVQITVAYNQKGKKGAMEAAKNMAEDLRMSMTEAQAK
jgi:hypothetical protein